MKSLWYENVAAKDAEYLIFSLDYDWKTTFYDQGPLCNVFWRPGCPSRSRSINPQVNVTEFPDLSDRQAGRHVQILYLVSIIFNLSIIRKKMQWGKLIDANLQYF